MNKKLLILFLLVFFLVFTLPITTSQPFWCCYADGVQEAIDGECLGGLDPVESIEECQYLGDDAITISGGLTGGPNENINILFHNSSDLSHSITTNSSGNFSVSVRKDVSYEINATSQNYTHTCILNRVETFAQSTQINLVFNSCTRTPTGEAGDECQVNDDCQDGLICSNNACFDPSQDPEPSTCDPECEDTTTIFCDGEYYLTTLRTQSVCINAQCSEPSIYQTTVPCEYRCEDDKCVDPPEETGPCQSDFDCPGGFICNPDGQCVPPQEPESNNCPSDPNNLALDECLIVNGQSFFGADSCAALGYSAGGELNCYNECQFVPNCFDCPDNILGCTSNMCEDCPGCANSPACREECTDGDIRLRLEYTPNNDGVILNWEISPACARNGFTVRRNSPAPTEWNFGANRNTYTDESVPQTDTGRICYTVTAQLSNGRPIRSQQECLNVINPLCRNIPDGNSFCSEDGLVTCNDGQPTIVQCDRCVGPDFRGQARCIPETTVTCDKCGGVFGLFTWTNNAISDCGLLFDQGICYKEDFSRSFSAVGESKECSAVRNCHSYLTQDTCIGNPCGVQMAQDCEWNNLDSDTGIGVCTYTFDLEDLDCNSCQDHPLGCSEEVCLAFSSEHCTFFSTDDLHPLNRDYLDVNDGSCLNRDQVICEFFKTEEECLGAGGSNFLIDIEYDEQGNNVGGEHEVLNPPNNAIEGTCVWLDYPSGNIPGLCVKDSNSMHNETFSYNNNNIPQVNSIADCSDRRNDLRCLTDFEPPQTIITVKTQGYLYDMDVEELRGGRYYSLEQLKTINVQVLDNMYEDSEIQTFFSIGNNVYPSLNEQEFKQRLQENFEAPGTMTINYYSVDPANNYEEIRSVTINLLPELDIRSATFDHVVEVSGGLLTNLILTLWNPYVTNAPAATRTSQPTNFRTGASGRPLPTTPVSEEVEVLVLFLRNPSVFPDTVPVDIILNGRTINLATKNFNNPDDWDVSVGENRGILVNVPYPLTSIDFVESQVRNNNHVGDGYGFFHYKIFPRDQDIDFRELTAANLLNPDYGTGYMLSRFGFNFCFTDYTAFPRHDQNIPVGGQGGLSLSYSNSGKLQISLIEPGQDHQTPEHGAFYELNNQDWQGNYIGIREGAHGCWGSGIERDTHPPVSYRNIPGITRTNWVHQTGFVTPSKG